MNRVCLLLQRMSERPLANVLKWSHLKLWPVDLTWYAKADVWYLQLCFEMFAFPVMQPLVCFSYVNIIAIPTTRLICNVGQLSTGKPVLVREKKTLYDERFGKIYRLKRSPKKKKFYDLKEDIWSLLIKKHVFQCKIISDIFYFGKAIHILHFMFRTLVAKLKKHRFMER